MRRGFVHKMRPEYTAVPINNFGNNLLRLKRQYAVHIARKNIEERAYAHDRELYPKTPGRWDGSEAQRLLKEDIEADVHKLYDGPSSFQQSRPEYAGWKRKKFSDHVWHRVRGKLESNYWLIKRKKAEEKKREIEASIDKYLDKLDIGEGGSDEE